MLLEVSVNGRVECRAGVEAGVASAFVNVLRIADPESDLPPAASVHLTVNGFVQGASRQPEDQVAVQWGDIARTLAAGDEVIIRVVDADDPDPPQQTPMLAALEEE